MSTDHKEGEAFGSPIGARFSCMSFKMGEERRNTRLTEMTMGVLLEKDAVDH